MTLCNLVSVSMLDDDVGYRAPNIVPNLEPNQFVLEHTKNAYITTSKECNVKHEEATCGASSIDEGGIPQSSPSTRYHS